MRLMSISIMKQVFKQTYDYLISSPAYNLSQNLLKLQRKILIEGVKQKSGVVTSSNEINRNSQCCG